MKCNPWSCPKRRWDDIEEKRIRKGYWASKIQISTKWCLWASLWYSQESMYWYFTTQQDCQFKKLYKLVRTLSKNSVKKIKKGNIESWHNSQIKKILPDLHNKTHFQGALLLSGNLNNSLGGSLLSYSNEPPFGSLIKLNNNDGKHRNRLSYNFTQENSLHNNWYE